MTSLLYKTSGPKSKWIDLFMMGTYHEPAMPRNISIHESALQAKRQMLNWVICFCLLTVIQIARLIHFDQSVFYLICGILLLCSGGWIVLQSARESGCLPSERPLRSTGYLIILIIVGAALRFWNLGGMPPGLWLDEAHHGLDAFRVLSEGHWPIFFPANTGREPMFLWMITASIHFFGPSVQAIRYPAALAGTLLIPSVYLVTRPFAGPQTALIAAGLMTFSRWSLTFSRIGFRTILVPLFECLIVASIVSIFPKKPIRGGLIAGSLMGLGFYTALPFRIFPLIAGLIILFVISEHRPTRQSITGLFVLCFAFCLTILPLALYFFQNPGLISSRISTTSVYNGSFSSVLQIAGNFLDLTGMMHFRADMILRHNIPGVPLFDPLTGLLAFFGIGILYKQRPAFPILLTWLILALFPAALAVTWTGPSSLRTLGSLPAFLILAASGMNFLVTRVRHDRRKFIRWVAWSFIILYNSTGYYFFHINRILSINAKADAVWGYSVRETRLMKHLADAASVLDAGGNRHRLELWLSPQLFLHATVQYLMPSAVNAHLIENPDFFRENTDFSETDLAVLDPVPRNMFWLRDSDQKRFFDYWVQRGLVLPAAIQNALSQSYIAKTGFNNTSDILLINAAEQHGSVMWKETFEGFLIYGMNNGTGNE